MHAIGVRFYGGLILVFILMIGCNNTKDKKDITTDMVHIPLSADGKNDKSTMPKFKFETTDHDFGTLMQGEKVSFTYKFKNAGASDLIISTVVPGCGCTVAQFTETPIKPEQEGNITINFNM